MSKFCFVVEQIEWETGTEFVSGFMDNRIMRVFESYEDAKAFAESNAKANGYPIEFKWQHDRLYSGSYNTVEDGTRYGITYRLSYVPLC